MYQRADAKAAALAVGVMVLAIALLCTAGWTFPYGAGIAEGGSVPARLLHPLVHGGLLHAAVNVYVLWQLVFFFPIRLRLLVAAYVVACCCPTAVALWTPLPSEASCVVGLSGIDYVLMGSVMPQTTRPLRFNALIAVWMLAGMAVGSVAVGMHLFCYLCGAAVAYRP